MNKLTISIFLFWVLFLLPLPSLSLANPLDKYSMNEALTIMSQSMNKNTPAKVDENITLQTTYVYGNTLLYKYIFGKSILENQEFNLSQYEYYTKRSHKMSICNDKDGIYLVQRGAIFKFTYHSIYGDSIIEITIDNGSCSF